jgi:transposase
MPSSACSAGLKDFRRITTRYDRLATNFLAVVCVAATISYWL